MAIFQGIAKLSRDLASGSRSSLETCTDLLAAAGASSDIGAFSDLLAESAMAEAKAADARRHSGTSLGPMDGIPVAVKDLIDTTPAICKAGLKHLSQFRPASDAAVVTLLRQAGAVILGVTETDPGAFSTETAQVINPLAQQRTVGGSSGGSAAAVAAGLAFAAIGTDTGGSIRIPAACCSIYGFKPSWGRVDTSGVRPLAPSLDHVGPLARSIADLQLVQSVIDPAFGRRTPARTKPLRLGISEDYFRDASDSVRQSMANVLQCLAEADVHIVPVTLPMPDEVMRFHMFNLPREAAEYHCRQFPEEWHAYPDIARATIAKGSAVTKAELAQAERLRGLARRAVDEALRKVDALILPTLPIDAPLRTSGAVHLGGRVLSRLETTIRYTALFNQTGHPVVSMPATSLPDGRALSIQLAGRRNADRELLLLAERIEGILSLRIDYAGLIASQMPDQSRPAAALSQGG